MSFDECTNIVTNNDKVICVRIKVTSEQQWYVWFEEFCTSSNTSWNVAKTYPNIKKLLFKKDYICQHNQTRTKGLQKVDTKCPARLTVTIKLNNYYTKRNDPMVVDFPCIVQFKEKHNHSLHSCTALEQLKTLSSTRKVFQTYFENGFTAAEALTEHRSKLLAMGDLSAIANNRLNPTRNHAYYLWRTWRNNLCGTYSGEKMFQCIRRFADNCDANVQLKEFGSDAYVCVIVTMLMKRVHTMPQSCEIVFVDSTSHLDQTNASLTVLLCGSPMSALPLGVVISSGQDEECYTNGFSMLKEMLGSDAFYGKRSPQVIMTDDGRAEKNALKTVWPESKQLLCSFHILQAVWRWLCASKNNVNKVHRQDLMASFKRILYSTNETHYTESYNALMELCAHLQDHGFKRYLECNLFPRKEQWCLAFRQENCITRGHNTNNCCEATIKIIKDVVFNRCKAYNPCQLLQFVVDIYNTYFTNRILSLVFNKAKCPSLKLPVLPASSIRKLHPAFGLYEVGSESAEGRFYVVDVSIGTCTCPVGTNGKLCKHQSSVILHEQLTPSHVYRGTPEEKKWYVHIAVGKSHNITSSFFESSMLFDGNSPEESGEVVAAITPTATQSDSSSGEEFEPEVNNARSELECVDATAVNEEALGRTMSLLKTKCSYALSSKEATDAINKFNSTLEKIKTPSQLFSLLHSSHGNAVPFKNAGRKIRCQPASISRRPSGAPRGAAPLGKGRKPSLLAFPPSKRPRNLAFNINKNQPNATGH